MRAANEMVKPRVIAFDFDGLLMDGLHECILVSWNGFYDKGVDAFGPAGLAAIPDTFKSAFKNHRNFSRHLGHFVSPFYLSEHFSSQADFDAAFATIAPRAVSDFVQRANACRQAAREQHYQRWLDFHTFYPGVQELLLSIACPVYIVTGKDAASAHELLQRAGVDIDPARIFGECQDKVAVLRQITHAHEVSAGEVAFFDDNVSNARAAHQAGFRSYWATWGYNAPDHFAIARAAGLPELSLDGLVALGLADEVLA